MTRDEIDQSVRDQLAAAPGSSAREIAKALFPDGRDSQTHDSRIYNALERLRLRGEATSTDTWPRRWQLADRSRMLEISATDAAVVVQLLRKSAGEGLGDADAEAGAMEIAEKLEQQLGDGSWTIPDGDGPWDGTWTMPVPGYTERVHGQFYARFDGGRWHYWVCSCSAKRCDGACAPEAETLNQEQPSPL